MKVKKFKKATALVLIVAIVVLGGCAARTEAPATDPVESDLATYEPERGVTSLEIDWTDYGVILNGDGVAGASQKIVDNILPTHVSLQPIAEALSQEVSWDQETGSITMYSPNGPIQMNVGSADFEMDGEVTTLMQPVILSDDESTLYVPIPFFRVVFSEGEAYFSGGHVIINTEASSDMF
ncbi:MAG: copper amine oxidase N-terminal domain-containing protein [Oscillospiraceae bacterium]|nr:copper amine oxidase N-terminal domain-containing protein [Oscillospiraceae bacterium]